MRWLLITVIVVTLAGCGDGDCSTVSTDCTSAVRLSGTVYDGIGWVKTRATKLGTAEMAECDDMGCEPRGAYFPERSRQVAVFAFPTVATNRAVGVRDHGRVGVYVARHIPTREAEQILVAVRST